MTAPTALNALAERVEKATEADRELDALAFGLYVALPRTGFICADEKPGTPGGIADHVPRYTRSFDAAMTLIDEEWETAVMWDRDKREAFAAVGPNALSGFPLGEGRSRGLNAIDAKARALTAAALRARAAQEQPA